ncbi:uncharacterized protein BYT42DRAFT_322095 [Radiomyces spectabilis]|uniref:uncharacterized protein n=1 Tax=Radiomyces spectabilis TaxID=64574 RepID=UPI002220CD5F|nr:uncharacterized protein BYT42DRAFT_322095 [Radiomyces spectabilis]KAI8379303.1 hypothetical protein BYT42DRAFT_322095 [Radiomyces spectabilis]
MGFVLLAECFVAVMVGLNSVLVLVKKLRDFSSHRFPYLLLWNLVQEYFNRGFILQHPHNCAESLKRRRIYQLGRIVTSYGCLPLILGSRLAPFLLSK